MSDSLSGSLYFGPPVLAIAAYLLVAAASGLAFYTTLTGELKAWSKDRSSRRLKQLQGYQLRFPIAGIAIGGCGFLAASLQIFGISTKFSLGIAIPLTIGIGVAVWLQLVKLLEQLASGGVKALDLEEVSLGEVKIPDSAFASERPARDPKNDDPQTGGDENDT
ncbi:MAG: hypothetical protein ACFB9N_00055 [Geitlerinemataceae cyanobacterium]